MTDEAPEKSPDKITSEETAKIDRDKYDVEEMEAPDWVTELDREILALLGNTGVIMTPSVIAKNIDGSRSSVSRRLSTLEAGGLVEKPERGHYRISDEGYARMAEKVELELPEAENKKFKSNKILTPEELEDT